MQIKNGYSRDWKNIPLMDLEFRKNNHLTGILDRVSTHALIILIRIDYPDI
jgi:hypothetical protein